MRIPKPKSISVKLQVPYIGGIEGTWEPNDKEREAAWEMYVELVTRISVAELGPEEGLLREALSSLYSLFGTTRSILRKHGPEIAQPKGEDNLSFGYLAVAILNTVLRPVLAKWHPLLLDYENTKGTLDSTLEHERRWEKHAELRAELSRVRITLTEGKTRKKRIRSGYIWDTLKRNRNTLERKGAKPVNQTIE